MNEINIISTRHIGDIFLDSIVLKSVKAIKNDLCINIVVEKKYEKISKSIQKLISSNIKVKSYSNNLKGQNIELSPIERPLPALTKILNLKLKSNLIIFRYLRPFRKNKKLNLKYLFLYAQYFFLKLIGAKKIVLDKETNTGYIINNQPVFHILDLLIGSAANFFRIDQETIRENIISSCHEIRKQFHKNNKKNTCLILPSHGGKGNIKEKGFSYSLIKKFIKSNRLFDQVLISNFIGDLNSISDISDYYHQTTYSNLEDLKEQIISSSKVIAPDSFPSHLSLYLGISSNIYIPGYLFGIFHPYPAWFPFPEDVIYYYDIKNMDKFGCCGACSDCKNTLIWENL